MTLTAVARGFPYPAHDTPISFATATIDAATEKLAMIGRMYWDGRPGSAKTLSTGTIQYRTAGVTFANGGTTVQIGIQDVATGSGPIAQPDGSFDVSVTLTGGGGGITANAWNTATMNSGTKSITHGDLIAVVWDMTARGGADTVGISVVNPFIINTGSQFPTTNVFLSSAWQTTQTGGAARLPNVLLVADDGTIGTIDFMLPHSAQVNETFQDSTNPDERGLMFQVPWDCTVDGLWAGAGPTDASSDFTLRLYSDPTGSPSQLATVSVLAEQLGVAATQDFVHHHITPVNLTAGTNYGVTVLATGTSNTRLTTNVLGNEAHRALYPGGTTLAKITRNGGAGAFSAESPAITLPKVGVIISHLHNTGGGGPRIIGG